MARPARTLEEVNEFKEKILDVALEMIAKQGFENFSMRKLAAKLDITATTIYNYYSSKDEIYLYILIYGFGELYQVLSSVYNSDLNLEDKVKALVKAYITFGIQNANYYGLMYTWDVPKFDDYVSRQEEMVARAELEAALRNVSIWEDLYRDLSGKYLFLKEEDSGFHFLKLWAGAHGIVSLYNSKVLNYVIKPTAEIMDKYVEEMVALLLMPENQPR